MSMILHVEVVGAISLLVLLVGNLSPLGTITDVRHVDIKCISRKWKRMILNSVHFATRRLILTSLGKRMKMIDYFLSCIQQHCCLKISAINPQVNV